MNALLSIATAERCNNGALKQIALVVGALLIIAGVAVWAFASPVAGAPDDDFHLGSAWCPDPTVGGSCEVVLEDGHVTHVLVPETVYASQNCWAKRPQTPASCADHLSDDALVASDRFNQGAYPGGYYHFQHLFVGKDVLRTVVAMRLANVALGIGGLVLVGALTRRCERLSLILAASIAWTPLGAYFIASNNPSGWAVSGVMILAGALVGLFSANGWRRAGLAALAVAGAAIAISARADAAFFVVVVVAAAATLAVSKRNLLRLAALAGLAAAAALGVLLSSTHLAGLTGSFGWPVNPSGSKLKVLALNVAGLPAFVESLWGGGAGGLGWLDTPLLPGTTAVMLLAAGGVLFAGARYVPWRKAVATSLVTGALLGVPVVSMTLRHVTPIVFYQARYMLPLLGVALLVWVRGPGGRSLVHRPLQLVFVWLAVTVANAAALWQVATRFSVGLADDLGQVADYPLWWPWAVGPSGTVTIGAVTVAIGVALLLWGAYESRGRRDCSQRVPYAAAAG